MMVQHHQAVDTSIVPTCETPDIILAWIAQLLDPDIISLVATREGQIEVRLFANRGKVRKHPTILLNSGPIDMVTP